MVMQLATGFWSAVRTPVRRICRRRRRKEYADLGSNHRPLWLWSAALPFDQQLCVNDVLPYCLEPFQQKLLTPPPQHPPTPPKSDIQF